MPALTAQVVLQAAAEAGVECDKSAFASSTALRKEMEERGIDTRTPGLRGKERKDMLLERFIAYFYKLRERKVEVEKQGEMRDSELEVVRYAAESKGVNVHTPGVYGVERKEVLLQRMYDPEPEPAPFDRDGEADDGTGSDGGEEVAKADTAPLTVGMWNQDGGGGKNDADVNFDGPADDVARAKEIKQEIERVQAQIQELNDEVNTIVRIQSDKLNRRMAKITDEDCGVARLMERVERTERDVRKMEAAHERTGRALTFQESQQMDVLRASAVKLTREIGVRKRRVVESEIFAHPSYGEDAVYAVKNDLRNATKLLKSLRLQLGATQLGDNPTAMAQQAVLLVLTVQEYYAAEELLRRVLGGRPHLTAALNHVRLAKLLARPERALDEPPPPSRGAEGEPGAAAKKPMGRIEEAIMHFERGAELADENLTVQILALTQVRFFYVPLHFTRILLTV
jgi:hypothetical protein